MARVLSNRKLTDAIIGLALLLSIASLIAYPRESVEAAQSGLELCMNVIIPSLFPFFVLSSLTVELGLVKYIGKIFEKLMRPLFNVNGSCALAFVLGFIGGYPVGAKTAISLYKNGCCSKSEAERLLSFCNNSGPAFILGVVGAGVFSSSAVGILLYLTHIAASVVVGMLFRFHKSKQKPNAPEQVPSRIETIHFTSAFTDSVKNSFQSTLNICAFVIFFTVVIRMLFKTGAMTAAAQLLSTLLSPLGFGVEWAERLIIGVIEMTSGVWSLQSAAGTLTGKLSMAAFILGWAGVSVHCQVLSFIGGSGLSVRTYIAGKALHGVISSVFVWFISGFLSLDLPVSHYYAEQITDIAGLDFQTALTVSTISAVAVWLLVMVISAVVMQKSTGKRSQNRV